MSALGMLPGLGARAVHVWQADLDAAPPATAGSLAPAERARAQRLAHGRARERWERARGILRTLLGGYLDADPRALRFCASANGKPFLAASPVSFNVSHSGPLAFFAFCASGPVGVDVQLPRPALDAPRLAARAFGPSEAARLAPLDADAQRREFLKAWVRYEAVCKCLGAGISISPGAAAAARGRAPWVAELSPGPHGAAAVAALHEPRELRHLRWRAAGS